MDRDWADERSIIESGRHEAPGAFALPSRAAALDLARSAASTGGPVLIAGEAGSGKTWLADRLASGSAPTRWVALDLAPGLAADRLDAAIARRLGLDGADPATALADDLQDRQADGRRLGLILDEAHNASDALLEAIRVLSNRLGRPDGFTGLVLVGQGSLARRLTRPALAGLEARLAARVHLRPIDADEAGALLARLLPSRRWDLAEVERLHRDSAGNPARLLRLAAAAPASTPRPASVLLRKPAVVEPAREAARAIPERRVDLVADDHRAPSLLGPTKPPLRIEDGLIEVGWEPTPSPEPEPDDVESDEVASAAAPPSEEVLDDHYAALQAWEEWAASQGRRPVPSALREFEATDDESEPTPGANRSHIRLDGPEEFAPYSQLFARARQAKDAE